MHTPHQGRERKWWKLFPPRRTRAVPWTGFEVFWGLLLVFVLWPVAIRGLVEGSPLMTWIYGPQFGQASKLLQEQRTQPNPALFQQRLDQLGLRNTDELTRQAQLEQTRMSLWLACLAFPIQVLTIPCMFFMVSGTLPYQLGLTWHRGWQNVGIGVVAGLIITPIVYCVHFALVVFHKLWQQRVEDHPFARLREHLTSLEMGVLFFSVLIAAPILEELIARGVLLRWCTRGLWRSHGVMLLAAIFAISMRMEGVGNAFVQQDGALLLRELLPVLFVLVLAPVYLLICLNCAPVEPFDLRQELPFSGPLPRPRGNGVPPALFATALLFAATHSFAWPSPVSLFLLALGLGWLAQRTQSLVGPIIVHSLFNAAGCVVFFMG